MNTPPLRFPEFKGDWEKKKLGELLEFKNGINASKEQYGKGVKFINVLDILNNEFITHDKIIGSVDVEKEIVDKYPVSYGDILFQRSSETREEVGSASVYLDREHTATFGGFVIRGRKIGEYEPVFLNKVLKTDISRDSITSKSGGSTRYNVGQEILSSVELSFPTIPEQTKIASFLTAVDEKLQALKKKQSLLEQYKKGVMQKIFSQELRFKPARPSGGDENGKEFAKWEVKKLGEVCDKIGDGLHGTPIYSNQSDIYFINGNNLKNGKVEISEETKKVDFITSNKIDKGLNKNSLLISLNGTIGNIAKYNNEKVMLSKSVGYFNFKENIDFYYYVLNSDKIQNNFIAELTGSTIKNLSLKTLRDTEIEIPCSEEQTLIANFLSAIDEKINHNNTQIQKNEQWKKGLLQKMFV